MTTLKTSSGSGQLPGVPLGKYRYRLAALDGRRVIAQAIAGVSIFGQVPLSTLLHERERSVATAQFSFAYAWARFLGDGTQLVPAIKVDRNHCSSVHIAFLGTGDESEGSATITLVQESREAVSASAPLETLGSLDVELLPGQSWAVNVNINRAERVTPHIYLNGYAICDSAEPFFS